MAKTGIARDLKDDEILRFLRWTVTESAAATYTEASFDTQLSIDRGLIWLIHFADFAISAKDIDDPAVNTTETISVQITRESKTAMVNFNDADLITRYHLQKDRSDTIGTAAGPDTYLDYYPKTQIFAPPVAYAAQNVWIGIQSTAAAAKTVQGRIGFTLRRVSDKFFYRVAQALIS